MCADVELRDVFNEVLVTAFGNDGEIGVFGRLESCALYTFADGFFRIPFAIFLADSRAVTDKIVALVTSVGDSILIKVTPAYNITVSDVAWIAASYF